MLKAHMNEHKNIRAWVSGPQGGTKRALPLQKIGSQNQKFIKNLKTAA